MSINIILSIIDNLIATQKKNYILILLDIKI